MYLKKKHDYNYIWLLWKLYLITIITITDYDYPRSDIYVAYANSGG